jgi:nicotinate-nucleotide pyrophosphorylase (carboxylating)
MEQNNNNQGEKNILNFIIKNKILDFLQEDIGFGDITSDSLIDHQSYVEAQILCLENATIAGLEEAALVFELLDCESIKLAEDSELLEKNKPVLDIKGKASSILKGERTALNILGRMSGIASYTKQLKEEINKVNPDIRLAATRKTIPGFRFFDKKAVVLGGGDSHRFCLDDAILIKDNHLKIFGSIELAIKSAKRLTSFTKKIEIETSSFEEALIAVKAGADIVMLDNLTAQKISIIVKELDKLGFRKKVILEASGKIDFGNIRDYAMTKVDVISSGSITHSVENIDFSLEVIKLGK